MDIVLIGGLWLHASAWDDVVPALEERGHRGIAVGLPGQGDGTSSATLDDQTDAVLAAVDAAAGRPLVVGHSAACTLAWLAADRRPDQVAEVAMIGGFPQADGDTYAEFFPIEDGQMPFPGWEPFEGPDAADLDEAARQVFAARAVAVPEGVARGVVRLTDDRRYTVPVVLVCPEFSAAEAEEWVRTGESAELAKIQHLAYVDIDTGHWPMVSAPAELAHALADVADQV